MSALHKVLVVDDDPVVGKSFNRVLSEDKGYVVVTAQNAQEALTKLREGGYDVVFTDIRMPGMDGLELAETVKAKHPWTPVVIVTGYGTTANEARAKAAGVSAFLHKPLSPEVIEGTAANAMREPAPAVAPMPPAAPVEIAEPEPVRESGLKQTLLFVAAPFVGLAYVVLFPLIGAGMLAVMGIKKVVWSPGISKALKFSKNVGLFVAAPFIGLVS